MYSINPCLSNYIVFRIHYIRTMILFNKLFLLELVSVKLIQFSFIFTAENVYFNFLDKN